MSLLTLVVPVREGASTLHLKHPRVEIVEVHGELESIALGHLQGVEKAQTPWVMLCNDDVIVSPQKKLDYPHDGLQFLPCPLCQLPFGECQHSLAERGDGVASGPDWAEILEREIKSLNDPYWLLYPDDGCFGASLSIFPILNRDVVLAHKEALIPPFKRYCLDPHLHAIFKLIGRVKYVPNVLFDHQNFYTDDTIPDWAVSACHGKNGRRYCVKPGPACDFDHQLAGQQNLRATAQLLLRKIQQHTQQACGQPDVHAIQRYGEANTPVRI